MGDHTAMNTQGNPRPNAEAPATPRARIVRRVALLASPDKPAAIETLPRMQRWLKDRAEVVFAEVGYDSERLLPLAPDLLIVLGGDGTLIAAVNGLGHRQIPVLGVNLGKLGYLADFTVEDLEAEGGFLFAGDLPVTRRIMMEVTFEHADGSTHRTPAINDCVVQAGPPFHMVHVTVAVDGDEVAQVRGDGVIVATPSGSTAHNLAAGGPILEPTAEAFILTPLCPQALTYRPVVMDARRRIVLRVTQANEGTRAVTDGNIAGAFRPDDRIVITRYGADFLLVRNPKHSEWHALRRKLRWGEGPNMH
jgi:NAD+ kinase